MRKYADETEDTARNSCYVKSRKASFEDQWREWDKDEFESVSEARKLAAIIATILSERVDKVV